MWERVLRSWLQHGTVLAIVGNQDINHQTDLCLSRALFSPLPPLPPHPCHSAFTELKIHKSITITFIQRETSYHDILAKNILEKK